MAAKLPFSMDKAIIEAVKKYAKKNNMSLSGIVELDFKPLSSGTHNFKISPITRELSGISSLTTKKFDRNILGEALNKRLL